jgi:Arylsulfotransferase (ASST)
MNRTNNKGPGAYHPSENKKGTQNMKSEQTLKRGAVGTATVWLASLAGRIITGALAMLLIAAAFGGRAWAATGGKPPPPVTILTPATGLGNGYIFVTPTSYSGKYANGPEILDTQGNVVWFHAIPDKQTAADFRTQRYHGKQVLTWWQGTGWGGNWLSCGTDYIYDNHFNQIATVQAGNGFCADGHEFLISPWNTALITIYALATADLTSMGGPADQTVVNGLVQEIDIPSGNVLFQWNSADHVPYSQSHVPLPANAKQPWDWFHINAIQVDTDGNLLIDSRHTWAVFKVDHASGEVIWTLGGRASSFTLTAAPGQVLNAADEIFAWQHDAQPLGNGLYSLFDNEAGGGSQLLPYSRAVVVQLDQNTHVATLVAAYNQPEGLLAYSQGNAQATDEGNLFVGWGSLPYFSAFDPGGNLIFNASFPSGVNSYRAYFLPFNLGR